MFRALFFGVAIVGGAYMYELQTGKELGVGRVIKALVSAAPGSSGAAVPSIAGGAATLTNSAARALGN